IVMFADSHIGATFHAEKFEKLVKDMEAQDPDVLVILGDYVDDDTSKEDMEECCAVLGRAKIRGGIYYVYGNHDRGYYSMERRGYGGAELAAELEKNGVIILRDETVLIQDRFYLTGREDASNRSRKSMEELLKDLDKRYFTVILDHQPHDFETQEKSGVDLVLCGHTHGGWLFPFNKIPEMSGTDDKSYGREKRSGTEFIVSSGISEWALKFKTGCPSEYVIIDVEGKKE
ncbi:MAG: metallophosphoesterase, partial [Parasporobacterium sp.]|nr:metallophosphoesterase [Parasporobacterium sp.]